jgi:hypothetical protein
LVTRQEVQVKRGVESHSALSSFDDARRLCEDDEDMTAFVCVLFPLCVCRLVGVSRDDVILVLFLLDQAWTLDDLVRSEKALTKQA